MSAFPKTLCLGVVFASLLSSCDSGGLATYCDPKYKVLLDYPTKWSSEATSTNQASNVELKPEPGSDDRTISVTVAATTPDAAALGTAAGRLGMMLSIGQGQLETSELDISHPEFDASGVLIDHGTRQVQMVYLVVGEPALFEIIATQRVQDVITDEQTESLRAIVQSIRRDVEVSCSAY